VEWADGRTPPLPPKRDAPRRRSGRASVDDDAPSSNKDRGGRETMRADALISLFCGQTLQLFANWYDTRKCDFLYKRGKGERGMHFVCIADVHIRSVQICTLRQE
jgi:hypothetical protein